MKVEWDGSRFNGSSGDGRTPRGHPAEFDEHEIVAAHGHASVVSTGVWAEHRVEAIKRALRGIPPERVASDASRRKSSIAAFRTRAPASKPGIGRMPSVAMPERKLAIIDVIAGSPMESQSGMQMNRPRIFGAYEEPVGGDPDVT